MKIPNSLIIFTLENILMLKIIFSLIILLTSFNFFAQSIFFVKDIDSKEVIPFAKIEINGQHPILSDIDGIFKLNQQNIKTISISAFGYLDSMFLVENMMDSIFYLKSKVNLIEEVEIKPHEDPAVRVINKAIENKKKNDPLRNDAFKYTSYSKFIFTVNEDAINSISDTTNKQSERDLKDYFAKQYLMLIESSTERAFQPPARDIEKVVAYKVSGFNHPLFASFANELQSFSFYDNQFQILGKSYLNPLVFGSTSKYWFFMQDTIVNQTDTTFSIRFTPKKNKIFEGLKGYIYINTNGYAIEKVIVEPKDSIPLFGKIKIVQEYEFIDNKKWFPVKLSTEMLYKSIQLGSESEETYIVGKGSMYINDIQLNPEEKIKLSLNNGALITLNNADKVKDEKWDTLRKFELTDKEKNTYKKVDSISKAHNLNQKFNALTSLFDGKIPIKFINIDLTKVLNYNRFEGLKLGLGIENSKNVSKWFTTGGYFRWGTKDKEWKYGVYSDFQILSSKIGKLSIKYQDDVLPRGVTQYQKEPFNLGNGLNLSHLYLNQMEYARTAQIDFSFYLTTNIKLLIGNNYQRIYSTNNYTFLNNTIVYKNYDQYQLYSEINWNIREKAVITSGIRVPKPSNYPKVKLKFTKGLKDVFLSTFDFSKIHFEIEQNLPVRTFGRFIWDVQYFKTIGNVPITFQNIAPSSGRQGNLSIFKKFETMPISNSYNKEMGLLFTKFQFNTIKTKKESFQPRFSIYYGYGIGKFSNKQHHELSFISIDKGYAEGGLIIDGIFKSGFSSFGIGVFYNYGFYASPYVKDNFIFKITLSTN